MGADKTCRVCGDALDVYEYGGGSVWTCGVHGVREWMFGLEAATWVPGALAAPRGVPPGKATLPLGFEGPRPPAARAARPEEPRKRGALREG